ncbi:MAG: carbamoyltransferase HypF [Pseudomonadales bacterium]|jgi:hydrogenase maturation protein HypF|nr:carbamoyltransferase HypF [Pseudomonadales bacterium]
MRGAAGTEARARHERIRIRGRVQGVGFRPHVHAVARRHGMAGWVLNDGDGVLVDAEGADLEDFLGALRTHAPGHARIDAIERVALPVAGAAGFEIRASAPDDARSAAIPPDLGLCEDCLRELFDPADRRYLHPFIACTQCGPRLTMTERLPYDRAATTMAPFELCPECRTEYEEPTDRRFHAEPIACHDCGPRLDRPVSEIAAAIERGEIVALKGIGGYHLACDARNDSAVARLRAHKRRDGRPLAALCTNLASAAHLVFLDRTARTLLSSAERPVVVLQRRPGPIGEALAPGLDTLGVMLPSTAVHWLLLHALAGSPENAAWYERTRLPVLVMTSANLSGDPLVIDDEVARRDLAVIADLIVTHDRAIVVRADDSVLRMVGPGRSVLLRRARGHVPGRIVLGDEGPAVLATGAQLKNTLTVTRDREAHVSQHVGDLATPATIAFQRSLAEQQLAWIGVRPVVVACDLHPDFASTALARELAHVFEASFLAVQHHHAHVAAVLAEHGCGGPVLGVVLDGFGLGTDGGAWGGELLRVDGAICERLGHFAPLAAAGGDRAAREPWRMAAGVLADLGRGDEIAERFANEAHAAALARVLTRPDVDLVGRTSAAARLFDAAAGLLGVRLRARFEGDAPMTLEGLVDRPRALEGGWRLAEGVLDFTPLLAALADEGDPQRGAELLHGTLIEALAAWVREAAAAQGLGVVALCGGCLQNRFLATELPLLLEAEGLRVLLARELPPNDGAVSLGQAWVARQATMED